MAHDCTPPRRALTFSDLKEKKGIRYSRQHVVRKVKKNQFPPPWKMPGSHLNHWWEDVVDAYLDACAEGRDWSAENNRSAEPSEEDTAA